MAHLTPCIDSLGMKLPNRVVSHFGFVAEKQEELNDSFHCVPPRPQGEQAMHFKSVL